MNKLTPIQQSVLKFDPLSKKHKLYLEAEKRKQDLTKKKKKIVAKGVMYAKNNKWEK